MCIRDRSKCVTDITEIKASDGKLYVSAVFDCFDSSVIGLAMDTKMKAPLCVQTLENTANADPGIRGAIIHSDRGSQYTSQLYRCLLYTSSAVCFTLEGSENVKSISIDIETFSSASLQKSGVYRCLLYTSLLEVVAAETGCFIHFIGKVQVPFFQIFLEGLGIAYFREKCFERLAFQVFVGDG